MWSESFDRFLIASLRGKFLSAALILCLAFYILIEHESSRKIWTFVVSDIDLGHRTNTTEYRPVAFIIAIDEEDYIGANVWEKSQQALNNETSMSVNIIFRFRPKTNLLLHDDYVEMLQNIFFNNYSYIFFLNDFDLTLTIKFDEWFTMIKRFVGKNYRSVIALPSPRYFSNIQKMGSFFLYNVVPSPALTHFIGAESSIYQNIFSALEACTSDGDDLHYCLNNILLAYKENGTLILDQTFYHFYKNKISTTGLKLAAANSERRSNSVDRIVRHIQNEYFISMGRRLAEGPINQSSTLKVSEII